jgi:hypothetical protein
MTFASSFGRTFSPTFQPKSQAAAGDITITLAASCTDDLATGTYAYDVQLIEVGDVSTLTSGKATVIADVTRAVA